MPNMNRRAPKRDLAEPAIIQALKAAGASVVQISEHAVPDLLVGYVDSDTGQRLNVLMEVKTGNAKPNEDQEKFLEKWQGSAYVVRTPEDALKIIGR